MLLFQLLVASGQRGGETFFSNPWLAVSILIAAGSAIVAGATAAVTIIWRRERSILMGFSLMLGFFVAVFVAGEILYPH